MSAPQDPAPEPFAPQAGIGLPLGIAVFGFAVLVLGMADARIFTPNAIAIFVPVAFGTGALGLLIAGAFELRANNTFGGTFCLLYAGFLLTTGLILRYWGALIVTSAGLGGFADAFGAWLLLWCVFTMGLSVGAYHINMPAFLAFTLLWVAYLLLGLSNIVGPADPATLLNRLGGWVLIADGLVAWYLAWALAVNEFVDNRIPLWPYPYGVQAAVPEAEVTPAIHA
jgi:hypothetical protein